MCIRKSTSPVAAVIIEPIASEGGDHHASTDFFRSLREICSRNRVAFIVGECFLRLGFLSLSFVDEVQTGVGATGTFWAHEKWNLSTPPDFMSFSKKMQAAGWYHNIETRAPQPYRNFVSISLIYKVKSLTGERQNTWMGDPIKTLQAGKQVEIIQQDNLVSHTASIGASLYSELESLAEGTGRGKMASLRGKGEGTFIAWDMPSSAKRDAFLTAMRQRGVNMAGVSSPTFFRGQSLTAVQCGDAAVRLRPMLIFDKKQSDELMTHAEEVMKTM